MPTDNKTPVPQAVHDFLSEQSHKGNTQGGNISATLIEMGKEALVEKYGTDWKDGIQKEMEARHNKAA